MTDTVSAREALDRLRAGNRRFAERVASRTPSPPAPPADLSLPQRPCAIVLGCSDARVPVEIVFDQGLGDLFVIRVAGNVVAPSLIGSVEFAADRFGTRLVVVLGHTGCGAVAATIEALRKPGAESSPNLMSIVTRVRPSVEPLLHTELAGNLDALAHRAMRANVRMSAAHLRSGSELLEHLLMSDGLMVVGAEYSTGTGVVTFFDGVDG